MSKIKSKHILLMVALVGLQTSSLAVGEQTNEPNYMELFNKNLKRLYMLNNPYAGLGCMRSSDEKPQVNPDYITFLANVLRNGPAWLPKSEHHLARCYAAMCLGATKDPKALDPLIEAMDTLDDSPADGREHISTYAIIALGCLGDANAVEPLIDALKSEQAYISNQVPSALSSIGDFRAVGPLIKMLEEKQRKWQASEKNLRNFPDSSEDNNIMKTILKARSEEIKNSTAVVEYDELLMKLTKTRMRTEHKSSNGWTKNQLAEIRRGDANTLPDLWSQWWRGGPQFTRARLEAKHSEWKAMKKENQPEKSNANSKLSEMADLGIPAIPFMVEKVRQGETDFIPLISRLTNKELAETATKEQCLAWWEANKQKWLIPFPEPNTPPADPNK